MKTLHELMQFNKRRVIRREIIEQLQRDGVEPWAVFSSEPFDFLQLVSEETPDVDSEDYQDRVEDGE